MTTEMLYDAIGEIRDDYILDSEHAGKRGTGRRWLSAIAACLVLVLLAIPVQAELDNGYVTNLLAPFYGSAQTELIGAIGVPIDASVAVGEYLLTAEAVIGDKYNIAFVYSLTRQDGGPVEDGLRFDGYTNSARRGCGGGWFGYTLSEDGRKIQIVEQYTTSGNLLTNRNVEAVFTDLVLDKDGRKTTVLEGEWKLKFTLRYPDTTQRIPVKKLEVTDPRGVEYVIRGIELSSVGIHLDMTGPNLSGDLDAHTEMYHNFKVSIALKDGTVLSVEEPNISGKGTGNTMDFDYGAMFEVPIPLEEIRELIICGTAFPVELPET